MRRRIEGDLLRHRQRRKRCSSREVRLRGVEGAAAAGSGEEAEEHAGARAPAEHRRRFVRVSLCTGLLQFALCRGRSGLGLLMVGFVKVQAFRGVAKVQTIVPKKFYIIFKIRRHIKSLNACIEY